MPQHTDCECLCGCPTCCRYVKYSKCETDEERHERIKASKRLYHQRHKKNFLDYQRKYRGNVPRNEQQSPSQTIQTPQLVLKIITPVS